MNPIDDFQFSKALIHLFKGVVYSEQNPDIWITVLNKQAAIQDYLSIIGLKIFIDESEGYAFLKQKQDDLESQEIQTDAIDNELPRIIGRKPLGYLMSLLCILLRKKLIEQDAAGGETRVILSREQIVQMLQVYLPEKNNEVKSISQIDTLINKVVEIGFLRPLKNDEHHYEIRRIIKALIDADWIASIDDKLKEYKDHANSGT